MSILSKLGGWRLDDGVDQLATAADGLAPLYAIGGGGDVAQVSQLPGDVAAAFGLSIDGAVSREQAMRVPTIRRARQVIAGTIGAQQLIAHRRNPDGLVVDVTSDRRLLTQPDPNTTLQYVLTWTVDSLLFHGVAWWRVLSRDAQGYPVTAEWLAQTRVLVDLSGRRVYVDGAPVPDGDLIRFDGPDEGLLLYAGDTLHTSRLLNAAVRRLAADDLPLAALKLADGAQELSSTPGSANDGTDRSEVDALLDAWDEARRVRSTAYLNRAIDLQTFTKDAREAQLAEGRQQQRIDEANLCNVPPRVVNAPSAQPMTYTNALAERADLVDTSLSGFVVAIEQRLGMGDVTPRGTTVRLDLGRFLQGDQLSALAAATQAVALGALTAGEVRTDVLGRVPLSPDQLTPPPVPGAPSPAPGMTPHPMTPTGGPA